MFGRTIAATALAGALVFAPTAAFATYPAPEDSLTCSATQVPTGTEFTCTVGGPEGASVVLHVTFPGEGTTTYGPVIISGGVATFTITAPQSVGVLGVSAVIDGEAADTASIDVLAASGADDELATTGFENAGLAAGAGMLLVAGAATVFVAARRRAAQNS